MAVIPEIYEQILKDCFWEYKFDEEKFEICRKVLILLKKNSYLKKY